MLALLRQEFPDVTISKIRFLESQGLVNPERTPSGYRKFYEHDVERLRWVLRQQREHFLPLKVIKGRLEQEGTDDGDDNGRDGPGSSGLGEPVLVGRATGPGGLGRPGASCRDSRRSVPSAAAASRPDGAGSPRAGARRGVARGRSRPRRAPPPGAAASTGAGHQERRRRSRDGDRRPGVLAGSGAGPTGPGSGRTGSACSGMSGPGRECGAPTGAPEPAKVSAGGHGLDRAAGRATPVPRPAHR